MEFVRFDIGQIRLDAEPPGFRRGSNRHMMLRLLHTSILAGMDFFFDKRETIQKRKTLARFYGSEQPRAEFFRKQPENAEEFREAADDYKSTLPS